MTDDKVLVEDPIAAITAMMNAIARPIITSVMYGERKQNIMARLAMRFDIGIKITDIFQVGEHEKYVVFTSDGARNYISIAQKAGDKFIVDIHIFSSETSFEINTQTGLISNRDTLHYILTGGPKGLTVRLIPTEITYNK